MAYIGQAPANKPVSSSDLEDGLITNSKLAQDIISAETELATAPADTDELLISDAGTLKRIDASLVGGGGITEADYWRLTTDFQSGTGADLTANLERVDSHSWSALGTGMSQSSGIYVFPSTGYWKITFQGQLSHASSGMARDNGGLIYATTNNSSYTLVSMASCSFDGNTDGISYNSFYTEALFDVTNTSNCKVKFHYDSSDGNIILRGNTDYTKTGFTFVRLGDT